MASIIRRNFSGAIAGDARIADALRRFQLQGKPRLGINILGSERS
jgi:hypothetical protein